MLKGASRMLVGSWYHDPRPSDFQSSELSTYGMPSAASYIYARLVFGCEAGSGFFLPWVMRPAPRRPALMSDV